MPGEKEKEEEGSGWSNSGSSPGFDAAGCTMEVGGTVCGGVFGG